MSKPRIAFYLKHTDEYGVRQLVATVVQLTDDGIHSPGYYWSDPAADLAVTAYLSPDQPHAWGWGHQYQPHTVDLHKARAMSRILARIQRRMANLSEQLGPPQNFHTYLLHLATALDIHLFLLRAHPGHPNHGQFRQVDTLTIGDWIRNQERQHAGGPGRDLGGS
jgi:hypothetical protein